jgi:hypothetical protein
MTVKEGSVAIECRVEKSGPQTLRVQYRLQNAGPPIFVLDQILNKADGRRGPDPQRVYTFVVDGDQLVLLKGLVPLPEGVQVEFPDVPYGRLVEANASLTGAFELPTVVPYDNPYDFDARKEIVVIKRALLRVGFVPADAVASRAQPVQAAQGTFYRFRYHDLVGLQRFVDCPLGTVELQLRL